MQDAWPTMLGCGAYYRPYGKLNAFYIQIGGEGNALHEPRHQVDPKNPMDKPCYQIHAQKIEFAAKACKILSKDPEASKLLYSILVTTESEEETAMETEESDTMEPDDESANDLTDNKATNDDIKMTTTTDDDESSSVLKELKLDGKDYPILFEAFGKLLPNLKFQAIICEMLALQKK